MPVTQINDEQSFSSALASAGQNLVLVDFTAQWCGPCQLIKPVFEELSNRFSGDCTFLKVDVDIAKSVARSNRVSSMPTFIFFRNREEITRFSGANASALESKIKELIAENPPKDGDCGIPGHFNLIPTMLNKSSIVCLNEDDKHPLSNILESEARGYLESDCDQQLIIHLEFSSSVRLHSIALQGPEDKGVKSIRLFINQPQTLDFDQVSSRESVQDITFTKDQIVECKPASLKYVKFQNVQNLLIFVQDNLENTETTVIEKMKIIGQPITTTKMDDFKRVTGQSNERH